MPYDFGFMFMIYPIMFILIIGALIIQYIKNNLSTTPGCSLIRLRFRLRYITLKENHLQILVQYINKEFDG